MKEVCEFCGRVGKYGTELELKKVLYETAMVLEVVCVDVCKDAVPLLAADD